MLHLSIKINGFSDENVALQGGLRGGYYGGYFEDYVIRDISYGLWTDARHIFDLEAVPKVGIRIYLILI